MRLSVAKLQPGANDPAQDCRWIVKAKGKAFKFDPFLETQREFTGEAGSKLACTTGAIEPSELFFLSHVKSKTQGRSADRV